MSDDYLSTTQTTGAVAVDGSTTGNIETSGDRDWFAVTLEAGRTYRIDLEGAETGAGTLNDSYLWGIHNTDGVLLAGTTNDDNDTGYNSRVLFTAQEAGTYYVAAGAYDTEEGTYTLFVTDVTDGEPDDFAAGTGTTGTVAVGSSTTGNIETSGDRDWFAVTLEAGRTYRIDLEGAETGAGTLNDSYLWGIHNTDGVLLAGTTNDDNDTGYNSRVLFTAQEAGTYYVAAGAYDTEEGTYTLFVTDVTDGEPDDFAAGTGTTGTVAVGSSTTGNIDYAGDRDWFAVTLEAGKTYRIDLEGRATEAGTLWDPYLHGVYDANGVLLADTTNDDAGAGLNSRVLFTAQAAGTYYVAAGGGPRSEGTYTLFVTDVDTLPDDFAAGTGTSGTVAVDDSTTGKIDYAGDRDWFAVTLEAGKTYRIDLEGSATGAGTLSNPYLRGVHDENGVLLAGTTNDNAGTGYNSRVFFAVQTDGTYYVAAGAYGLNEGTYTLSVTNVPNDLADGTGTTGTVAADGSTTGDIETSGDRDWFAVTLEAGKTYRIDLEGSETGDGTLSDPYLHGVHDENGVLLDGTTNDDADDDDAGRNSQVFFTAQEAGTYYVAAGAYREHTGTYTLSVTEVPNDLADGTGTTGTVAVDGSTMGEIETWGDRDWFAVTLEAGKTYRIALEGWETRGGTLRDPYLHGVYDENGVLLDGTTNDDAGASLNSRVFFTAQEDGTYYVAAGAYRFSEGTYTLSVTNVTDGVPDDFTDGTGTTGSVTVDSTTTGAIDYAGDRDWFAVTLEAGKTYRIDLEGSRTGAGTLSDPYLYGVHDESGVLLDGTTNDDDGASLNSRVWFTAQEAGTYYVAAGAYREHAGTYTLSVTNVPDGVPDDFTAGTGTSGTVAVDSTTTGVIDYTGDRDWFAVTLEAGKTYRIDLEGSETGDGTLSDPYLHGVYDENGVLLDGTTNDDTGAGYNSRVFFTAQETGTYYVAAGAYGSREGTYTLSVANLTDNSLDDFTAGPGTTGTVAVGSSTMGEIETAGDRDWFAVTLEMGKTYRIDLEGSETGAGAGTLSDPYLWGIHDTDGVLLDGTTNDDGGAGLNSRVFFTAQEAGTYYVAAGAYLFSEGTYTLSVEEVI